MMRNDVKLGLAVGGVLLAVLIVYVLVVPGGSDPGGVELVTVDGTVAPALDTDIDENADTAIDAGELALLPDGTPRIRDTAADPFANSRNRTARDDGQRVTSNGTAGGWDWARLLNGESAPTLMTETDVPTGHGTTSASEEASPPPTVTIPAGTDAGILPGPGQPTAIDAPTSVGPRNALVTDSEPVSPASPMATGTQPTANGTSPAAATPTGAPAAAAARTHIVQPGETFSSIALAAYGGTRYYAHIQRANPSVDPMRLKPGMTIVIPPLTDVRPDGAGPVAPQATLAAGTPRAARDQQPIDARTEYRVAPNDSLYKIAVKLYGDGIRHAEIYELNKQLIGPDPARLKVGTVLKLPAPPTSHMSAAGR